MKIKLGDVVQLASGGPHMTVVYLFPDDSSYPGAVNVSWFDNNQDLQTQTVLAAALVKVEKP